MKETGIIRRIDDVGRVTVPKSVREQAGVRENDMFEVSIWEGNIILHKYTPKPPKISEEHMADFVRKFRERIVGVSTVGDSTTVFINHYYRGHETVKYNPNDKWSMTAAVYWALIKAGFVDDYEG